MNNEQIAFKVGDRVFYMTYDGYIIAINGDEAWLKFGDDDEGIYYLKDLKPFYQPPAEKVEIPSKGFPVLMTATQLDINNLIDYLHSVEARLTKLEKS